ncbi:hypothetical protein C8J56DRAFT_800347 [Mycena floridula]|nr:hypothetical protein C8J56DRAFT_800347 [Mycena floridula]
MFLDLEFHFIKGHPQATTHALRLRKVRHIPVLTGTAIPRCDLEDQHEKYAVTILALFKPWARSKVNPLKSDRISWSLALSNLLESLPE